MSDVTRHILEQTRRNSDDLADIKTRLDRMEGRFDGLDRRVDGIEQKLDRLDHKVGDLIKGLPTIVTDAVRAAKRARRKK